MKADTVTVSPKYQVVIPEPIRKQVALRPGDRFHVIYYQGRVELIRMRKMCELRGFLRGIDTKIEREGDRL